MRRIFVFLAILAFAMPSFAQTDEGAPEYIPPGYNEKDPGHHSTTDILQAIAEAASQRFPGDSSYNLIVPATRSMNEFVDGAQRWMTNPNEPFVCLRHDTRNACLNCHFDCRRLAIVQPAIGTPKRCADGFEPVCTASGASHDDPNSQYRIPMGIRIVDGFYISPPEVIGYGDKDCPSTDPNDEACRYFSVTGGPEFEGYFYRYWDAQALVRPTGGARERPGAWSPAYPRICYKGYDGVSKDLKTAENQFATDSVEKASRTKSTTAPSNVIHNYGGLGPARQDYYAMKVSYELKRRYAPHSGDDFVLPTGEKDGQTNIHQALTGTREFPVYDWLRRDVDGNRCLYPVLSPSYTWAPDMLTTRVLFEGDKELRRITTAGDIFMNRYSRINYKKLPCGLLDDSYKTSIPDCCNVPPDQRPTDPTCIGIDPKIACDPLYIYDPIGSRFLCSDIAFKKVDSILDGAMYTQLQWNAKVPSWDNLPSNESEKGYVFSPAGVGPRGVDALSVPEQVGGTINIRQCFVCSKMSEDNCLEALNALAAVTCGKVNDTGKPEGTLANCGEDDEAGKSTDKIIRFIQALNSPRDASAAYYAPPENEIFPVRIDCNACRKRAESHLRSALINAGKLDPAPGPVDRPLPQPKP